MQMNSKLLLIIYLIFLLKEIEAQEKKCPNFKKFGSPINLFYTYFRDVFNVLNPKETNFSIRMIHYSKNKYDDNMKFLFEVKNIHSKRFLKKSFIGFSATKIRNSFNIMKYIESNEIEDIKTILNVEKVSVFDGIFCDELKERFIARLGRADFVHFVLDENKDIIHKKFEKLVYINEDQFNSSKIVKKSVIKKTTKTQKNTENSGLKSKKENEENNLYLSNLMKLKQEIIKQETELQKLNDLNKIQLNELQYINNKESTSSSSSNSSNKKYNQKGEYNDFFKNNNHNHMKIKNKNSVHSNLDLNSNIHGLNNNRFISKKIHLKQHRKKKKENSSFSSKYIYRFIK